MEEKITIYNCFNKPIGAATRKDAHKKGLWHRTVFFLVLDPLTNEIIFQDKESIAQFNSDTFYLKLNGGHISEADGDNYVERELREEFSLQVDAGKVLHIGKYPLSVKLYEEMIINEFIYFYIVPIENAFDKIKFEDGEVKAIISFNVFEAVELLLSRRTDIDAVIRDDDEKESVTLKRNNFKNLTDDNLYLRILLAAKRYLRGEDKEEIVI